MPRHRRAATVGMVLLLACVQLVAFVAVRPLSITHAHTGQKLSSPPRAGHPLAALDAGETVSSAATTLTSRLREKIEDAEDELLVEVVHSKKFLFRGDGLREDFAKAGPARRRALLKGCVDNEQALWRALADAEVAGLPHEYLEDGIRVANELAIARAQLAHDYERLRKEEG